MNNEILEIPLRLIDPTRFLVRHSLGSETWAEGVGSLAQSIAARGQLQPAGVMPKPGVTLEEGWQDRQDGPLFDLVYGHRRYHAVASLNDAEQARTGDADRHRLRCVIRDRPASEADVWAEVIDENDRRSDLTPSERAEAEAKLKAVLDAEARISTRQHVRPGLPSYGQVRARATGESVKTVENRVRLGESTPALRTAVDLGVVTERAAYTLASAEPDVQVHTLKHLHEKGIRKARPQDVAAAMVYAHESLGRPVVTREVAEGIRELYTPGEETKNLADSVAETEQAALENGARLEAALTVLSWYADPLHYKRGRPDKDSYRSDVEEDKGELARAIIEAIGAESAERAREVLGRVRG